MTTLDVEIPIGTARTSRISASISFRPLSVGLQSFIVLLNNQDGSLNGVITPSINPDKASTLIKINSVDFFKGYVWDPAHDVKEDTDDFEHKLRLSGSCYGADLLWRRHTEEYEYNTEIDDIIRDAISDSGSEITGPASASTNQVAGGYKAERDFLLTIARDLMERENYDGYVDMSKAFQLIDLSSPPVSGITLKCVAGASDNNILAHTPIKYLNLGGTPIKNYVEVVGQRVRDGWTEPGTATHYTGGTNTAVHDHSGFGQEGKGSIYGQLTYDGANGVYIYLDFSGGLFSKTLNYLDWSVYGHEEMMFWTYLTDIGSPTSVGCRPRLVDTSGNDIEYYNSAFETAPPGVNTWYWLGAPVGTECAITAGLTANRWHYLSGSSFNWQIEKIGFYSPHPGDDGSNYQDKLYVDDLRVPEQMVSISEDATSQTTYRQREITIPKPYIRTQIELNDISAKYLAILKDPVSHIKLLAKGEAGIISSTNKWLPAHTATLNVPALGINNETWRMLTPRIVVEPRQGVLGTNHDFVAEVGLVKQSAKVRQNVLDAVTSGNLEPLLGSIDERIRVIEKKRVQTHSELTGYYWSKQP